MFARLPARLPVLRRAYSTPSFLPPPHPNPARRYNTPLLSRLTSLTPLPLDLFRVQVGHEVRLRPLDERLREGRKTWDLMLSDRGGVGGADFERGLGAWVGPNGASLRPNGRMMRRIIEGFNHPRTVIFRLPRGTTLQPSLTILHEHTDHYSLQTTKRISLDDLNAEMTRFFVHQCEAYTKEQWLEQYGLVGETRGRRW